MLKLAATAMRGGVVASRAATSTARPHARRAPADPSRARPKSRDMVRSYSGPVARVLHDEFFLKAKAQGYLARSAYKLLEIQERFRILRAGDRVLDLGCAPGSWMQVTEKVVGPRGVVVGIDLSDVDPRPAGNFKGFGGRVAFLRGDAFQAETSELLALAAKVEGKGDEPGPRLFDVVLSDMAPNTSGHGDDLLSARLCRRVLEVAGQALRPGGNLAMKVLEGGEKPALLREARAMFAKVAGFKPRSSRDVSREMFIVAGERRG